MAAKWKTKGTAAMKKNAELVKRSEELMRSGFN
mgnify:CR=1 FL=1